MTSPNYALLERISALWQTLSTHQDLPALKSLGFDAAKETVYIYVASPDAVDAYAEVFGTDRPTPDLRWHHSKASGKWTYMRYDDRIIISADHLPEPLPQHGVETAENTATRWIGTNSHV